MAINTTAFTTMKMNSREENHVNGTESFWSYAKFRMAKLRGVQKEKFLIHLKESAWRFNHRNDNVYSILLTQTRHFPL
jgi:transposase-like protein